LEDEVEYARSLHHQQKQKQQEKFGWHASETERRFQSVWTSGTERNRGNWGQARERESSASERASGRERERDVEAMCARRQTAVRPAGNPNSCTVDYINIVRYTGLLIPLLHTSLPLPFNTNYLPTYLPKCSALGHTYLPTYPPTYQPFFYINNSTRKGSILRAFLCKVEWLPLVGLIPPRNVSIPIGYWAPNPQRNGLTLILRPDVLPSMGKGLFVPML
jgi:hypothetical protein